MAPAFRAGFILALVVSTSSASPLGARTAYPAWSWSQGFYLVANVTNSSLDLTPSIDHWYLDSVRIGAGLATATLTASGGQVFYENGTDDSNTGVVSDGGGTGMYPYGMTFGPLGAGDVPLGAVDGSVDYVGVDIGPAAQPAGIRPPAVPWAELYGPDSGTFIVCAETDPAPDRPPFPLRFAKEAVAADGQAHQPVPAGCAPITLLAQCAPLSSVPAGSKFTHTFARTVRCYQNVSSISWS